LEPASEPEARQALARVLDPAELDAAGARRARASLSLPEAWLREPSRVCFVVPRRLGCDACEGGGCGGCGNRGGFLVPEGFDRTVSLSLAGGGERVRVRVVPTFAASSGFEVLLVEIRSGEATLGARRIDLDAAGSAGVRRTGGRPLYFFVALGFSLLVALALTVLR
jgi:hypothetical protein